MSDFDKHLTEEPETAIVPAASDFAEKRPLIASRGSIAVKSTKSYTLTPTGLQIVGNATEEEWEALAEAVLTAEGSLSWVLGDLFIAGANKEWGAYKRFAAKFHLEWRRIENYIYTCRNVDFTLRSVKLSYSHHRLVAPFYDEDRSDATRAFQRKLLEHAIANNFTVADFAAFIASLPSGAKKGDAPALELDKKELAIVTPAPFYEQPIYRLKKNFLKRWGESPQEERAAALRELKALVKELEKMK